MTHDIWGNRAGPRLMCKLSVGDYYIRELYTYRWMPRGMKHAPIQRAPPNRIRVHRWFMDIWSFDF